MHVLHIWADLRAVTLYNRTFIKHFCPLFFYCIHFSLLFFFLFIFYLHLWAWSQRLCSARWLLLPRIIISPQNTREVAAIEPNGKTIFQQPQQQHQQNDNDFHFHPFAPLGQQLHIHLLASSNPLAPVLCSASACLLVYYALHCNNANSAKIRYSSRLSKRHSHSFILQRIVGINLQTFTHMYFVCKVNRFRLIRWYAYM